MQIVGKSCHRRREPSQAGKKRPSKQASVQTGDWEGEGLSGAAPNGKAGERAFGRPSDQKGGKAGARASKLASDEAAEQAGGRQLGNE